MWQYHKIIPNNFFADFSSSSLLIFPIDIRDKFITLQVLLPRTGDTLRSPTFYGLTRFISVFTTAHHRSVPKALLIKSIHVFSRIRINTIFSYTPRSPQVVSFVFLWTFIATYPWFRVPRMCAKCSAHPILLFYLSQTVLGTAVETVGGDCGDYGDDRLPKEASLSQRNNVQERSTSVYFECRSVQS